MERYIKILTLFALVLQITGFSFSAQAEEKSCRHLFHNHDIDSARRQFMRAEPGQQSALVRQLLAMSTPHSAFEIIRSQQYHKFSSFEQKYFITPIAETIYNKIGFFNNKNLLYSVIKDVNGELWAVLVSEQISPQRTRDVALFKVDYITPSRKGPIMLKAFVDNSVL